MRSFVLLGNAMNSQPVTTEMAESQLRRADKDGDDMISRNEWLEFSQMLGHMDDYAFKKLIRGYIDSVRKLRKRSYKKTNFTYSQ